MSQGQGRKYNFLIMTIRFFPYQKSFASALSIVLVAINLLFGFVKPIAIMILVTSISILFVLLLTHKADSVDISGDRGNNDEK